MGRVLQFDYDQQFDTITLMLEDYGTRPREQRPGTAEEVNTYPFLLNLIVDLGTGEVVGFGTEGVDFSREYPDIVAAVKANPWPERYDVPELGLIDAALEEILTAIYQRFVLGQEHRYPMGEERVLAHKVAEGRLDDKEAEED
jgi:hypothetical protein